MIATLVFGNGIGMALDPKYFLLQTGLNSSYEKFSPQEKKLISLDKNDVPSSEPELERHHLIMTACQELTSHENINLQWLSADGKQFPNLYQDFIYKTATHFFKYDEKILSDKFIDDLCQFIATKECCHIATLNYDKLLYAPLINRHILEGYRNGGLVDGFYETGGFNPDHLFRTHHKFGWYLHLHGSPLFYTKGNIVNKCKIGELPDSSASDDTLHNHIVLADTKIKPEIISNSKLLGTYFMFFRDALDESDELYLIGYSGADEHVNFEIKNCINNKSQKNRKFNIHIIEWQRSNHDDSFWIDRLFPAHLWNAINNYISLQKQPFDNILDFRFEN